MARYQVLETSCIGDKVLQPFVAGGNPTIVEFNGEAGKNLKLLDASVKTKGVEAAGATLVLDTADDLA